MIFIDFISVWNAESGSTVVSGRKVQANAEEGAVDPPKVEEKIGAVPNGLQTDSDVVKRLV